MVIHEDNFAAHAQRIVQMKDDLIESVVGGRNCPETENGRYAKCSWGRAESAGINRHRVGDERAPHERRSCSIVAPSHVRAAVRLHVKQLTGENAGQPLSSEITGA